MPSPYVTTAEAAVLIGLDQTKHPIVNTWKWLKRHDVRVSYDGRRIRILRESILAVFREQTAQVGRRVPQQSGQFVHPRRRHLKVV